LQSSRAASGTDKTVEEAEASRKSHAVDDEKASVLADFAFGPAMARKQEEH
jgi:hypothetical protein